VFDVVASPSAGKHGTQMKYADHRGAVYVLTLEGDGAVSVKDMRSGERSAMPAAEAPARLAELAAATQAT
jgi:histidyl-tRNA synthetase